MRRAFTTREKVLLVILALMLIGIGYFKLLLEPINDQISQYQLDTATEQDEVVQNTVLLTKMREMEKELEEIKASGDAKPLPNYDNSDAMLTELNTILSASGDYSLTFGSTYQLEESSYIMCRPVSFTFNASSYEVARSIIDELHASANINQTSDMTITFYSGGSVRVTMTVYYFELVS